MTITIRCPNEKCYAEIELNSVEAPLPDTSPFDAIGIIPEHWHEKNDPLGSGTGVWTNTGTNLTEARAIHIQRRCKLSGSKFWLRKKVSIP